MVEPKVSPNKGMLMLALTWQRKGELEKARAMFERMIDADPTNAEAHIYLADLLIKQNNPAAALPYLQEAIKLRPKAGQIQEDAAFLDRLVNPLPITAGTENWPSNPNGKIKFRHPGDWSIHRSGWGLGMDALKALHNQNGVLFDGFLEDLFAWQHKHHTVRDAETLLQMFHDYEFDHLATSEEKGMTPYQEPWVGFFHNPPNMPPWFHGDESAQAILARPVMQESLKQCKGLFTLSKYHADWLREQTQVPVSPLILPTEIPETQFSFNRFQTNPHKKIVQIGWWLRQQSAIDQLPVWEDNPAEYQKMRLIPKFYDGAFDYLDSLLETEVKVLGITLTGRNLVEQHHLSNAKYDQLLTENIIFIHLFDASANNTVIEAIARATPVLVNKLPAVVEYLGADYPFYYSDFDDAAQKAMDMGRVQAAHQFLKVCPTREKLSAEYFRRSFEESEVYASLEIT
ncbi:MAG: tetratricopeptide repeat protein [Chloroflexota bacterium]